MSIRITPEAGMGATEFSECGASPYTIIEVINNHTVKVQKDVCIGYFADDFVKIFNRNPNGKTKTVTYRSSQDRWVVKGQTSLSGVGFVFGFRKEYNYQGVK